MKRYQPRVYDVDLANDSYCRSLGGGENQASWGHPGTHSKGAGVVVMAALAGAACAGTRLDEVWD